VAVEVLAGLVAHGGAWVGVAGGDLYVAQAHAGVEHGRHVGVSEHLRVHPGHPDAGAGGPVLEATGGGAPVHPGAEAVAQDRPVDAVVDGAVDRSGHCWRERERAPPCRVA